MKPPRTPLYRWTGLAPQGELRSGTLHEHSAALVRARLRRQGISVQEVRRQWRSSAQAITARAISAITRQWAALIRAGVSAVPALQMLERSATSTELAQLLAQVRSDVETGMPLSAALGRHPDCFDALYVSMVHAGESAGILDIMMEQLAQTLEKNEALARRMRSALTYPAVVTGIALGVLVLLLVLVVPVFEDVFRSFGAELPWSTQMVLGISRGLTAGAPWFLLLIALVAFWVRQQWQQPQWQRQLHRRVLDLPALGPMIKTAVTARWAHTLSALLTAGVPLAEALPTAGQASNHPIYARINHHLQRRVVQGGRLSEGMAHTGRFPDMLVQLCATGEDTGTLDALLARAAELLSEELDARTQALSSLIEPLIIVVLGGTIGVILVAMYLPIFRLGQVF
jgi:type IV pilus assembly protein PilC